MVVDIGPREPMSVALQLGGLVAEQGSVDAEMFQRPWRCAAFGFDDGQEEVAAVSRIDDGASARSQRSSSCGARSSAPSLNTELMTEGTSAQ